MLLSLRTSLKLPFILYLEQEIILEFGKMFGFLIFLSNFIFVDFSHSEISRILSSLIWGVGWTHLVLEPNLEKTLFQWELPIINKLLTLIESKSPTETRSDHITWKGDSSGIFSVKSFMDCANNVYFNIFLSKEVTTFVWQNKSPPRARMTT